MKQIIIWLTCFALLPTVALANDEEEEEDDYTQYVNIPRPLRGQGYSLKMRYEIVPLKGRRIEASGPTWYQRIYLLSPDKRIVGTDKTYAHEQALADMEPDNMRVGFYWGSTIIHGEAFDDIFVADPLTNFSFEFIYQPGPVGFMLNFMTISAEHNTDFGNSTLRTNYRENQTRLGATYDFAPMIYSSGWISTMHVMFYGGMLSSRATVSITDDVVTIEDEDSQNGAFAGVEIRFPLWEVWLSGRLDYSYHQAKFNEFDLDNHAVQRNGIFGVSYAF